MFLDLNVFTCHVRLAAYADLSDTSKLFAMLTT